MSTECLNNLNRMTSNSVNSFLVVDTETRVEQHSCGDTKFAFGGGMDLGFRMGESDQDRGIRVY